MHTKNSPVLPKPKCKTCHEHQGHTHCQGHPAHRAVMICGQDTHRCPHKPTHCFTAFLCSSFVTGVSPHLLLLPYFFSHPSFISPQDFPMSLEFSFSTSIFFYFIFILFGSGVPRIPNFSPGSLSLLKNHLFPSQRGSSFSSPQ